MGPTCVFLIKRYGSTNVRRCARKSNMIRFNPWLIWENFIWTISCELQTLWSLFQLYFYSPIDNNAWRSRDTIRHCSRAILSCVKHQVQHIIEREYVIKYLLKTAPHLCHYKFLFQESTFKWRSNFHASNMENRPCSGHCSSVCYKCHFRSSY